jgi:hypothetical protein
MHVEGEGWHWRPVLLGIVGALACLAIERLIDMMGTVPPGRLALATGIAAGAAAFGFTVERVRLNWSVAFGIGVVIVAGLVSWWNGTPDNGLLGDWSDASLILAIVIAAPLFQTARDEGRAHFPYPQVHAHVWTNIVLWCASWAFVGVVFALAWLMAALFELIGIDLIERLLMKGWIDALLIGGAFGAALGLFREREAVVRTLRRVVTAVLAVLAPVLGAGLLLFLLALPFTGLDALWEATKATTPILLVCALGAWVLANTVIGDGVEDELGNPVLRWGATALAVVILPLAVIAAIATGLRIDQYGFTPDRLWALAFVVIACAVGIAWWVALARERMGWAGEARTSNLRLAFGVMAAALFLATPILSFNAISAHDQVARLQAGKVAPERFDWAALAFDFGEPGKRAAARLTQSGNAEIARLAKKAVAAKDRWTLLDRQNAVERASTLDKRLRILPRPAPLPRSLREKLADWNACGGGIRPCTVMWQPGSGEAISIGGDCKPDRTSDDRAAALAAVEVGGIEGCTVAHLLKNGDEWTIDSGNHAAALSETERRAVVAALARGEVSIRPVERRQVFIGGVPVGEAFE